jgi:hypothetical protein
MCPEGSPDLQDAFLEWLRVDESANDETIHSHIDEYESQIEMAFTHHVESLVAVKNGEKNSNDWFRLHMQLAGLKKQCETGSPLALVEALLESIQSLAIPPAWALERLHSVLADWYEGRAKTLDAAFGLKPAQGEHSPPLQKRREFVRDGYLCYQIHLLKTMVPGLPDEEAARLVASQWTINESPPLRMISPSTLCERYADIWRNKFDNSEAMAEACHLWKAFSMDERRALLCSYPDGVAISNTYLPSIKRRYCNRCDKEFEAEQGQFTCSSCHRSGKSSE